MGDWTFFSNYGHVLVCLSRNNEARLRDVASEVGITERAVQKIVRDMQEAGFITVSKQGRCNRYRFNKRKSLRHSLESHCNVGKLLALITRPGPVQLAPVPEPVAVREPVTAPIPEPVPVPEPAQSLIPNALDVKKKADKKSHPVDDRHQGSLF